MRWRDRFCFCAEALFKAQAETGEIKGHYLNATAGTCEEMIKRAVFARELGVPIVMHDYLTGGFTANTTLAHYCRDNGLLLHIHRAMHAVIDRQKNHGIHFRVLAKALRMSGGDHIHAGTVVGKLEGERDITLGFVDLLRDDFVEQDRSRGIYFTQDWVSLLGVLPVASGGIHSYQGYLPVVLKSSKTDIHSWTLQVTSYPHMESAQGRNPIQWVTGTGLDIKDREKRISAKKENSLGKQSQGKLLASALPHH
nr:hypothetical protein [Solanum melongena]WMB97037.1 hypothetical protein [Solanum aethiopicum]